MSDEVRKKTSPRKGGDGYDGKGERGKAPDLSPHGDVEAMLVLLKDHHTVATAAKLVDQDGENAGHFRIAHRLTLRPDFVIASPKNPHQRV